MFKKIILIALLLALVIVLGQTAIAQEPVVPGQGLLRILPSGEFPLDILEQFGGSLTDSVISQYIYLFSFPDEIPLDTILMALANRPGIEYAIPNLVLKLPELQQISQSLGDQSPVVYEDGVSPAGFYGQSARSVVRGDTALVLARGEGVTIAVIDNGLALEHPLFESRIALGGFDFLDGDLDPSEISGPIEGHGTFVSGLIALTAPNCKILPLRAFDENGTGNLFALIQSIYYAIDIQADIINLSLAFYTTNVATELAVSDALAAGIVVVASSGNDGLSVCAYPAAYDGVLAVGAVDTLEIIPSFSNYGYALDMCAPGVQLYSSLSGDYEWGWWSGTSFSTALVSGACALVLQRDTTVSPYEMYNHLRRSARDSLAWGALYPEADSVQYGDGILDVFGAVLAYTHGDMDNSGIFNLVDITWLISRVYIDHKSATVSDRQSDFNCDGSVNLADITALISLVYLNGDGYWPCY